MFDILIKNGMLVDGTGKAMYQANIGIKEDRIVEIGELHNEKGEIEIDAEGKIVCPGFIDVNNHSDTYWQIFQNPNLESLLYQGITTIIGGNCGSSLAPLADSKTLQSIQKWSNLNQINFNWLSLKEFFDFLETKKISVNFGTLTGHGTLRRGILKDQMRGLEQKELDFVKKMLTQSFKEGALGMSTGLVYTHARSATVDELSELANIIKKFDGVYVTHVRDERKDFLEAIEESIKVAEKTGVKLHIAHLKVMGENNWDLMDDAFYLLDKAHEKGMEISFDVFPYTNTGTVLYTLLPNWVSAGGKKVMLQRLKDQIIRKKVIREMQESGFNYSKIEIAISLLNKTLGNKSIAEIAKSQEKSLEEAVLDILLASEGRVITSMEVLSEENVEKAIMHPLSIISTNGAGYNIAHSKTGELVHPRSFGAFPKVLAKYVKEKKIISWEEAIRKMTLAPAKKFGIEKRGKLELKYFADIAIIDQNKIEDLATADNPYQYSQGVETLIINGQLVLDKGKCTGLKNGKVLRR